MQRLMTLLLVVVLVHEYKDLLVLVLVLVYIYACVFLVASDELVDGCVCAAHCRLMVHQSGGQHVFIVAASVTKSLETERLERRLVYTSSIQTKENQSCLRPKLCVVQVQTGFLWVFALCKRPYVPNEDIACVPLEASLRDMWPYMKSQKHAERHIIIRIRIIRIRIIRIRIIRIRIGGSLTYPLRCARSAVIGSRVKKNTHTQSAVAAPQQAASARVCACACVCVYASGMEHGGSSTR